MAVRVVMLTRGSYGRYGYSTIFSTTKFMILLLFFHTIILSFSLPSTSITGPYTSTCSWDMNGSFHQLSSLHVHVPVIAPVLLRPPSSRICRISSSTGRLRSYSSSSSSRRFLFLPHKMSKNDNNDWNDNNDIDDNDIDDNNSNNNNKNVEKIEIGSIEHMSITLVKRIVNRSFTIVSQQLRLEHQQKKQQSQTQLQSQPSTTKQQQLPQNVTKIKENLDLKWNIQKSIDNNVDHPRDHDHLHHCDHPHDHEKTSTITTKTKKII